MKINNLIYTGILGAMVLVFGSCEEEEDSSRLNAVFSYVADGFKVNFTDFSENGKEYTWDFGDGSELSTSKNPVHVYTQKGEYLVQLSISNQNEVSTFADTVYIAGPNIKIDGDFTDWEYVEYNYIDEGGAGGTLLAAKTFASPGHINFYIEGTEDFNLAVIDIYLDADNNPETGFKTWMYPAGSGAEFLIEGNYNSANPNESAGSVYAHIAPDNGWGWEAAYAFSEVLRFSSMENFDGKKRIEFSLSRDALGNHKDFVNFCMLELNSGWTEIGSLPLSKQPTSTFLPVSLK